MPTIRRRAGDAVFDFQLTDAELEIAHKLDNADLKQILRREGADIGVRTQAFMKLVARVRAERLLHEELIRLRAVKDQLVSLDKADAIIREDQKVITLLQRDLEKAKSDQLKELAAPAMAEYGEPTGR